MEHPLPNCSGRTGRFFNRSLTNLLTTLAVFVTCQFSVTKAAFGQETALPFVDGLRARGYYDTAIEHLDQLSESSDLPAEVREILDLERGLTLQQMGSAARVPEDRDLYLSQAEQSLRRFVTEQPNHSQAAFANSSLGELLFERARTLIWQSDSPSNGSRRTALQEQARQLIRDAEAIFQKAHDLYEAQYKRFPTFIDQARDPDEFQQRLDAEAKYLRAWFNLSRCTYEQGQTYDRGSDERRQLLIRAAEQFDAIHTSRRTNFIGLNARLMMGKCFQEQNDLGRALGIYNEMLSHDSQHPGVQNLKSIALHYRLICLNDPQRHDHQVALKEAAEWIEANRSLLGTASGLGILWEKAIAEEKLAEDRSVDARTKEVLLRQAMADGQQVARYPGAFREPANALVRRLKAALGDKDKEPRDFETAFERARGMIDQIQKLKDDAEQAASEQDRQQKRLALDLHLNEVGRLLQLALELRSDETDPKAVAQARYLLSFIFFRQRKNYDAIIMSRYCMEKDRSADPETALNATEIAITAAVQAWNDAPADDREFETLLLRDVCTQVLQLYPQSTRGNEARMRLGRVYLQLKNPLEASKWFLEVPESDPQYPLARISAGQGFWAAWTNQTAADEDTVPAERHSADDLKHMKDEARRLLEQGIQLFKERLGSEAAIPDEVIAAEISLAAILNLDGDFAQTIQRLTSGGENSVISTLTVNAPEQRPETGVLSRTFTGLALRMLLRAYVGTQQLDEAVQTMAKLEQVGGQDIAAVGASLGMEVQEELKRLKLAGDTQRLADVRKSFEVFLDNVFQRRDPSDYNSLLWIGETYYGLGQGVADDALAASGYYENAATAYRTILEGNLAKEPTITAIRLRLARCRRQQQQFEQAFDIARDILQANPLALDAQFEAALILSDWGSNGQPEKLLDAIQGIRTDSGEQTVWGWSNIAKRLQQSIQRDPTSEMKERFLDARYQLSACRRRYAETGGADGETQLRSALAEITIFTQVYRDIDDAWWSRFDRLFQDIQADLGQSPKPLERPVMVAAVQPPPEPVAPRESDAAASTGQANAADASAAAPSSGGWMLPLIAICLAAGVGVGFYFLLSKPPKRRRPTYAGPLRLPPAGAGAAGTGGGSAAIPAVSGKTAATAVAQRESSGRPKRPPLASDPEVVRRRRAAAEGSAEKPQSPSAGSAQDSAAPARRPAPRSDATGGEEPPAKRPVRPRPSGEGSAADMPGSGKTSPPPTGTRPARPAKRPDEADSSSARPRRPAPPPDDAAGKS